MELVHRSGGATSIVRVHGVARPIREPATAAPAADVRSGRPEALIVLMSGAAYDAGGGNQRPSAMARAFAEMGWEAHFHNHSRAQVDETCEGVRCHGREGWRQVRDDLLQRCGVLVVGLPVYIDEARAFDDAGWTVVYDIMDDWPAFVAEGAMVPQFVDDEPALVRMADHVIASAPQLCDHARRLRAKQPLLVPNAGPAEPVKGKRGRKKVVRAVYAGHLRNVWLDWRALRALANQEGIEVVVIGAMPENAPAPVAQWRNFRFTGEVPYAEALRLMATCHVGLVPFQGMIAHAVDPLKYYDYVACGLWTVATDELWPMRDRPFSTICKASEFAEAVRQAGRVEGQVEFLRANSWQVRCEQIVQMVRPPRPPRPPERFVDYCDFKLRLGWACSTKCNAAPECPYCCTAPVRHRIGESLCRPAEEIVEGLLRITERYGPFYMVSGWGDGMANDEVAGMLGEIAKYNRVDITSNIVFPEDRLALLPRNGNINFCTSFHPHLWGFATTPFLKKLNWIRDEGFPIAVIGVVAYPPYLDRIERWIGELRDAGYTANALRFGGEWRGMKYPEAYTEAETAMLLPLCAEETSAREHLDLYLGTGSPRGRMCRAGMEYCYVGWDGTVRRCVVPQDDDVLGNIFDDVELLTEAKVCQASVCPCSDLWQYIQKEIE